jgi:anti-anti-sigma regulatory factor
MTEQVTPGERVILEGALTIRTAEAVRSTLREAFEGDQNIAIDCTGAEEIDLSFVQLLIAARVTAVRMGKTVSLIARPEGPLLDTLTRVGFGVTAEPAPGGAEAFWFGGSGA